MHYKDYVSPGWRVLFVAILQLGVSVALLRGAAPPNDNFADAYLIPSLTNSFETNLTSTTEGATVEPGEEVAPILSEWNQRGTIWWQWTCAQGGEITLAPDEMGDSLVAVGFGGSSLDDLFPESLPDPFGVSFGARAGATYWFAVMMVPDSPTPAGPVSFTFSFHATPPAVVIDPPPNDSFANRIVLAGTNVTVQSTNTAATTETGENVGPGFVVLLASVWYSWTAPTNGVVYFSGSATNADFSFSLGTYRGDVLSALTVPPATPDGGFFVEPGDTFQLQVASAYDPAWHRGGGSGWFTLNVRMVPRTPASANDWFADRIEIPSPTYHFEGSLYGATNEPGEPLPDASRPQTLWWRFIPPEDGLIQFTLQAPFATALAVYEGDEFALLNRLPEGSGQRFRVRGGREYSVQLASAPAPSGGFSMDTLFRSTSNDLFVASTRLEGTNVTYTGNLTFATAEPNEPLPLATNTVWASWTAPFTGRTRYYAPQTYVTIYTGSSLTGLQPLATAEAGNYSYLFMAIEGVEYYFQFSGGLDDFTFSLQLDPFLPASNDNFANAERLLGSSPVCNPRTVADATMEPGEPLHLGGSPQKSLWWVWQAPAHGEVSMNSSFSFVSNVVLAAYQGTSLETLRLMAKGTNELRMSVIAGESYYVAVAVPIDATADVMIAGGMMTRSDAYAVPGNVLREPSWEGTGLSPQYWGISGSLGGYVNEVGVDGNTWPVLGTGTRIWQDFPAIPGHEYRVRFGFAFQNYVGPSGGVAGVQVSWGDQVLGVAEIPESEGAFWHWADFFATASNEISRVTFVNLHRNVQMDAFSVVDMTAPPSVVAQPASISAVAGGRALFIVGAEGTLPLTYQWHFNGTPLLDQTAPMLVLDPVSLEQAGDYWVTVTNTFGAVTSATATLVVDAPTNATILVQPWGDILAAGSYFNFSVVAAGTPPLFYQWLRDGQVIETATNRNLMLTNVQSVDAGVYVVRVQNAGGTVLSLPATLTVTNAAAGGGMVQFCNRFRPNGSITNEAPVFDIDGVARLIGDGYLAQLYAGPSAETLRPVGQPTPFFPAVLPGIFRSSMVLLPNVPPGATAFLQARAWERDWGTSYEEARALGGKFGRSEIFTMVPGNIGPEWPPETLGLTSFHLQSGLPQFTVGKVEFVERQPEGVLVWALHGGSGFRYVVEKSSLNDDGLWRPFTVLTNATGTVTFTDTADPETTAVFYRARILD